MVAQRPEPWLVHFFQRDTSDDRGAAVPAMEFLAALQVKVAAEIHAILEAVSEAPPPAFSGGGKWEAMHGDMAGLYEVRVSSGRTNHRLFCLLARVGWARTSRRPEHRMSRWPLQAVPLGCPATGLRADQAVR